VDFEMDDRWERLVAAYERGLADAVAGLAIDA
jgi:hypothetical protein